MEVVPANLRLRYLAGDRSFEVRGVRRNDSTEEVGDTGRVLREDALQLSNVLHTVLSVQRARVFLEQPIVFRAGPGAAILALPAVFGLRNLLADLQLDPTGAKASN